jgi:uncharacterized membrane protein YsdA (DUF1294 family)
MQQTVKGAAIEREMLSSLLGNSNLSPSKDDFLARPWLSRLNPFAWMQRWFTTGVFIWLMGTSLMLFLALTHEEAKVSAFFAIYLLLTVACSAIAFVLYGIDKQRAKKKQQRISERTLHVLNILGGWPGAHLAQRLFHHKSMKVSFRFVFWLIVVVHLCIIVWGIWSGWPITATRNLLGI